MLVPIQSMEALVLKHYLPFLLNTSCIIASCSPFPLLSSHCAYFWIFLLGGLLSWASPFDACVAVWSSAMFAAPLFLLLLLRPPLGHPDPQPIAPPVFLLLIQILILHLLWLLVVVFRRIFVSVSWAQTSVRMCAVRVRACLCSSLTPAP